MNSNRLKVILNGVGAVGQRGGRLVLQRPDMECVGAVDIDPAKIGKDLGELLGLNRETGITVSSSLDSVIVDTKADIVVDATRGLLKEIQGTLFTSIKAGMNFVSSCGELAYPVVQYPELAHEIDDLAKKHSVTVLGTGINPGFSSDLLPLVFSGVCEKVRKIRAIRASEYSGTGKCYFGVGKNSAEVEQKYHEELATGAQPLGHMVQMIREIADTLGWKLSDIRVTKKSPLISKTRREDGFFVAEPGQVCGLEQECTGFKEEEAVIILKYYGLFQPTAELGQEDGITRGDYIFIEGEPNISVEIKGFWGYITTAAHLVNAIPYVVNARPGLLSMKDFPPIVPIPID